HSPCLLHACRAPRALPSFPTRRSSDLDYQRLRNAGRQPYLLIGPWFHGEFASWGPTTRDSLAWLNAQVKGDTRSLREQPVRLFRSEEHTSELQSLTNLVCRLLLQTTTP